ncbi:hypothetical protein L917_05703 [Phytophthora nicotianae]|uniref:Uncharacterized protein n=1 Tax=Phytophthora nicotianae TaxID=4792 RepID=W2H542_PHYNI|nr:hypothetical protein L915_05875 [Phytophthora nicotianae]ETL96927.1 hypothetical protein L917_05703 [Phytophthora nicotianae]
MITALSTVAAALSLCTCGCRFTRSHILPLRAQTLS